MYISKEKSRFIITLDNGKQTYYDFADNKIYGLSGKPVKNFCSQAKQALEEYRCKDFIAGYFYYLTHSGYDFRIRGWQPAMVETLYSLYSNRYNVNILENIAIFCAQNEYKLDSKGVKILTQALDSITDNKGRITGYVEDRISKKVIQLAYGEMPEAITYLIESSPKDMKKYVINDLDKIIFRYEHENWGCLGYMENVVNWIREYIKLCNYFKMERTYKNFYLSLCHLEKEKELIADKIAADFQLNAPLFFENEKFITVIPTTSAEFKAEGDAQANCVFRVYYPQVKEEATHIVFIRRKNEPNLSYITCEVNLNGKICQYLTRFNNTVEDPDALAFKIAYQNYLEEKFNQGD